MIQRWREKSANCAAAAAKKNKAVDDQAFVDFGGLVAAENKKSAVEKAEAEKAAAVEKAAAEKAVADKKAAAASQSTPENAVPKTALAIDTSSPSASPVAARVAVAIDAAEDADGHPLQLMDPKV